MEARRLMLRAIENLTLELEILEYSLERVKTPQMFEEMMKGGEKESES